MNIAAHIRMINRMPWAWPSVMLTVASGLLQGFGLAMFVPLLEIMDGGPMELNPPFSYLRSSFHALGIPFEPPFLLAAIVALNVGGLALNFAQRCVVMGYSFTRFIQDTNTTFIDGILRASWGFIAKQATGVTTNQLINEAIRAGRALTHLVIAVAIAVQVIIFLTMSVALSAELLSIAVVFGGLTLVIVRPLQRHAMALGSRLTETRNRFGFYVVDYFKNLKVIKATGSEQPIYNRLSALQSDVCGVITKRQINAAAIQFVVQAVPVALVACAIWVAYVYLNIEISILLIFLLFLARTVTLINQLQQEFISFLMERSAIIDVDQELARHAEAREPEPRDAKTFNGLGSAVVFERVSYVFDDADDATVRDVSLDIKKSEFVAIVGGSGAGKSTIIDLLCALRRPTEGSIRVDGIDLRDMDLMSWRRKLGYVTQEVAIFNDTIRNNLTIAVPDATDAEIADAISIAHLSQTIDQLPDGLDTVMGEGGVRLSGGQKQRLALARALVGNPSLLLLDEATSALDNESERLVQDAIDAIAHRFTIVVVAHRLSTVKKADRIHVMENGAIVETGTYDSLVAAEGRFATLHGLQFQ